MKSRMISYLMSAVFVSYIFMEVCFCASYVLQSDRTAVESVSAYFENIHNKDRYIDIYGAVQNILGKLQIENFTIYKNSYGKLVEPRAKVDAASVEAVINEIQPIWDHLVESGIPFLYIESPLSIVDEADLPYGVHDYSHENAQLLHEKLQDIGIETIDVSEMTSVSKEQLFYRTDHHWSGDTCFETYLCVGQWMVRNGIRKMKDAMARDAFERITVPGFLGSYGIKAGRYYNGEDDFVYYKPRWAADIEFSAYTPDGELLLLQEGVWSDALMDSSLFEDANYKNKYNAVLYGNTGENRIVNRCISDGRLLIISHSYGRPLAQYFCLNFHEVRQIDPQKGRFHGNYLSFIDAYEPDVVLFLCEFEGEIIGEYGTRDGAA